ncbi:hypothetical protein [Streptomyces sp. NPDC021020]|uniref:hypothetical protein n=1 Tax=Streptomyces sp. NPDC021020 TaxID=3365109 RepID=UPI0037B3417A
MRRVVTTALLTALLAAALPAVLAPVPASASPSAAPVAGIWMEDCLVGGGHPVAKGAALTCHGGEFDGQPIDAG